MASTETKHRRGTDAQCNSMTPAEGEIIVDLTNDRLRLGDGSRAGGYVIPNAFDLQQKAFDYSAAAGTADVITLALSPAPASYSQPLSIRFKASGTNTTAVSINVNGLGARDLVKVSAGTLAPLTAGDLVSGGFYDISYDGTQFVLVSSAAEDTNTISAGSFVIGGSDIDELINGTTAIIYTRAGPRFYMPWSGVVSTSFQLRNSGGVGISVYGRIYKNGTGVGTARVTTSTSFVTYSENISVSAGDYIELYLTHGGGTGVAQVKDFIVSVAEYMPALPRR